MAKIVTISRWIGKGYNFPSDDMRATVGFFIMLLKYDQCQMA